MNYHEQPCKPYQAGPDEGYGVCGKVAFDRVRALAPFNVDDLVWVEKNDKAVKAIIQRVAVMIGRDGELNPYYHVALIRKDGQPACRTINAYPGDVFRGYKLANECPEKYLSAASVAVARKLAAIKAGITSNL